MVNGTDSGLNSVDVVDGDTVAVKLTSPSNFGEAVISNVLVIYSGSEITAGFFAVRGCSSMVEDYCEWNVSGGDIVKDFSTESIWVKSYVDGKTWQEAVDYCDTLDLQATMIGCYLI